MARKGKPILNPRKAVAFIRVSTEDQALGPEAQREALRRWAVSHGVELVVTVEEIGVSGGAALEDRPMMMAALAALAANDAGVLLVAKRDRLARDVMIAAMIERLAEHAGARVASADGVGDGTGPEAFILRGVMDLFAAYERLVIKARTKSALAVKKARGERVGQVPFGYRPDADGVRLEPDPCEQAAVARIHQLRASGVTYARIAEQLGAEGHKARRGRWHVRTVFSIARRGEDAVGETVPGARA